MSKETPNETEELSIAAIALAVISIIAFGLLKINKFLIKNRRRR